MAKILLDVMKRGSDCVDSPEESACRKELGIVATHDILNIEQLPEQQRQEILKTVEGRLGITQIDDILDDAVLSEQFLYETWNIFLDRALQVFQVSGYYCTISPDDELSMARPIYCPPASYSLLYLATGSAHLTLDGHSVELKAPQIILASADLVGSYNRSAANTSCSLFRIGFLPDKNWNSTIRGLLGNQNYEIFPVADSSTHQMIDNLFTMFIDIYHLMQSNMTHMALNIVENILFVCNDMSPRIDRESVDARVEKACDFISENYKNKFTVDDVASHVCLATSTLSGLFKETTGVNMMKWRDQVRVSRARELLLETDKPIKAVALEVGYEDPLFFSRRFKLITGWSPSDIRQKRVAL